MAQLEKTLSVIITAYNIEGFVCEAIQSVIDQSHQPHEIIVVDDGSSDGTRQAVERFGAQVTYCYEENGGTSMARNTGVQHSSGCLIAFLDGDDLWHKDKLRKQLKAFHDRPGLDLSFTLAENFHSCEGTMASADKGQSSETPLTGCIPSTLMITRDAFFRVGLFLVDQKIAEFVPWYAKARECRLSEYVVPEVMVRRRIHATNKGIVNRHHKKQELLRMFRDKIHRDREAAVE